MGFWLRLWLEYFLFVFMASCGVIQIAAAYSRLHGLMFFRRPLWGYVFAAVVTPLAFLWFFKSENRNVPGLEGSQQFGDFCLGFIAAVVFSALFSSLLRARDALHLGEGEAPEGLEALREMTYLQAIRRRLRNHRG
jgi:hypothetical protein